MRKCVYFALFVALVIASPRAHALSVTGTGAPVATIAADGSLPGLIAGGTLLDVYEIVLHSDSTFKVVAFNFTFTGTFAQVQLGDGFGTNVPTPLLGDLAGFPAAAGEAQDTHFVPNLTIPAGSVPTEGIITFGNTGTGFADGLSSDDVGIAGAEQAPSVLIAQIVVLSGTPNPVCSYHGFVAVGGSRSQGIELVGTCIPEPASAVLLLLGSLQLCVRGRLTGRSDRRSPAIPSRAACCRPWQPTSSWTEPTASIAPTERWQRAAFSSRIPGKQDFLEFLEKKACGAFDRRYNAI